MSIFRRGGSDDKKTTLLEKNDQTKALMQDSRDADDGKSQGNATKAVNPMNISKDPQETKAVDAGGLFRKHKTDTKSQGAAGGVVTDTGLPAQPSKSKSTTMFVQPVSDDEEDVSEQHPKGPVTGWLVVVLGPKKGESYPLRHGPQVISRSTDADVQLLDSAITEQRTQAIIQYDPNTREFTLNRGEATPNMYVQRFGDKLKRLDVGTTHILENADQIHFGDNRTTIVQFTPLCGDTFCWTEQ